MVSHEGKPGRLTSLVRGACSRVMGRLGYGDIRGDLGYNRVGGGVARIRATWQVPPILFFRE